MTVLRLAIASDIHAAPANMVEDSYVLLEPPGKKPNQQPLEDLIAYVKKHHLSADYVVCPGDITNRADETAKVYGWRRLHDLNTALGGTGVLAAPGNHDIVTRTPNVDPRTTLRNLLPSFPTGDEAADAEFWQTGLICLEREDYRFVIVDSCHEHGPQPADLTDAQEAAYREMLNRGDFTERQQRHFDDMLQGMDERRVNVMLLHHHPKEHQLREYFKDYYGAMRGGDTLLEMISEAHHTGRWLIIHGHKHIPQLVTASGDSNAPIILGAASLGAVLWHPPVTVTRNLFHLVTLHLDDVPHLAPLRGTIASFMWGFGMGWRPAIGEGSGMPASCGFGNPVDHRSLVRQVRDCLDAGALSFAKWRKVVAAIPALEYQHPSEFARFEELLELENLFLHRDSRQRIVEVSREWD